MSERPYTQTGRVLDIEDMVRQHEPVAVERIVEMLGGRACIRTVYRDVQFLEKRCRVTLDRETNVVVFRRSKAFRDWRSSRS